MQAHDIMLYAINCAKLFKWHEIYWKFWHDETFLTNWNGAEIKGSIKEDHIPKASIIKNCLLGFHHKTSFKNVNG